MAQWSNYWKIVQPATRRQLYTTLTTDAYDPRATDLTSMAAVSWYSQVLRGPGSRMALYKQYEAMDTDIDIARALDVVAEEMTNKDEKTNLPFEIQYNKEDNQDITDTTAITLRAAVRQWSGLQELHRRNFNIARTLIKYGDCFFRKSSDTKKWIYIDPSLVYGIEVDQDGNKISYHLKKPHTPNAHAYSASQEIEVVPASAMLHFTMSDEMGDMTPFGSSVLRPVFRIYRQLSMLEDATIIYRIVRAPERRVFYVDVGNMPPQRIKQYLEQIKNELRQKRVPGSTQGGQLNVVDGQLDPASMQEDYFFPVTAAGKGSRVETLPGGAEDFGTTLLKYFQDKIFRGLRIPVSFLGSTTDGQQSGQYNDGKVGVAYIEELRFANYVRRLQDRMESIFDREFKIYLKVVGLNIDDEIFNIRIPDPANFALYRQAALDADLISSFNNIAADKTLSRRFILKRYLGLTDDEIQMNEVMIKEERNIVESANVSALQQIYDSAIYDNREAVTVEQGDPGAGLGGLDLGGGDDMGNLGGEQGMFGGEEEAPAAPEPKKEPEKPASDLNTADDTA